MRNEFYLPSEDDIRFQSKSNRQGRSTEEVPPDLRKKVLNLLVRGQESAYQVYDEMITANISRELARINLPLSLYTTRYIATGAD